ncbi:hypothetical protein [Amycolatopsis dendrobii]|uniref:Uncharacterized protein n=1 Tax=Amycolatopsis dendrobii TaxID=2760662 RepID=A0A7W3ZB42_9PSEU|nr:hypothetical protein [Amycolatopsis dendrobii]MBB1154860.1 hypothetical protein [Amycolatopsis dendrobii]
MTQPVARPKVTGIGIAVAVFLVLLEILAARGGLWSIIYLGSGGKHAGVATYASALYGLLAIVVLVGVGMIFARRQPVGRTLLWAAPVQLLCALVSLVDVHSWDESVTFGVITILAVVLWLPAVSAKTPPPMGYGMPYGAPVPGTPQYPMGQQYPGQQYPQPGPVPPQYPQQYGASGMPQQYPQQPPYPQQPMPGQPMPGQWPASGPPQQNWPGQ